MEKFKSLTAKVLPLPIKDIDTDMIIPAQFLTSVSRDGYGQNLFRRLRDQDPQFPLNMTKYQDAAIMLTDNNFGCGSSREHAVWAILDAGFKVVISKSFADIFYSNAAKNGLVLVTLPEKVADDLLLEAKNKELILTVDLEKQQVQKDSEVYNFTYDSFRKHCILNGLDDIDYILSAKNEIAEFRKKQMAVQYVSTLMINHKK
jgi:3-isopropylmalate/(R)-2-methylmalate dehydratase small subunit